MDSDFGFGIDPVSYNHSDNYPERFVSRFLLYKDFESDPIYYYVSWSNALRFRRFLNCFYSVFNFVESTARIKGKLIRFDLSKYYLRICNDFGTSLYDDVDWKFIDDSGLIKLRSKKSK